MTKRHPGSGLWVSIGKGRKWKRWIETQQWKKEPSVCEGLRGSVVGAAPSAWSSFPVLSQKRPHFQKWQQLQLKCLYFPPLSANILFTGWGQLFLGIKPIQLNPQKCTILISKKRANLVLGKEMMDHEEERSLGSLYFYLDLCHIVCVWMLTLRALLGHYLTKRFWWRSPLPNAASVLLAHSLCSSTWKYIADICTLPQKSQSLITIDAHCSKRGDLHP